MNGVKTLSPKRNPPPSERKRATVPLRIAEIKAFKNTDFSDCPILTDEELKKLRPRHPEYFKPKKQAVQIRLDADVLAWFKGYGKGYQSRINNVLREVMLHSEQG